jgi:hypothetical protein
MKLRLFALLPLLAACSQEPGVPQAQETEVPAEFAASVSAPEAAGASDGTPLAERVATLGLLNKRNNISQDIEMKPGESRRVGNVIVRLASCERTPPWENPPEAGAFVQVLVQERPAANSQLQWRRIFSGWLFKNNPSLNVVEHPVYDVWVKDCAMDFPDAPAFPASRSNSSNASGRESAEPESDQGEEPGATPTPSPTPAGAPA